MYIFASLNQQGSLQSALLRLTAARVANCLQVEESVNVTEKWVLSMKEESVLSQVSTHTTQVRRWFKNSAGQSYCNQMIMKGLQLEKERRKKNRSEAAGHTCCF